MNLVIPIVAIVGALLAMLCAAPLSASLRDRALRAGVVIGWLGVLAGAAGIFTAQISGLGALLGVAGCAGLAVLGLGMKLEAARDFATPVGAAIALVAGVLGVTIESSITGGSSAELLLYAGHWGTLGAALVAALVASSLASSEGWVDPDKSKAPGLSVGLALAALSVGAYLQGVLRAAPEGMDWVRPLWSSAGPVRWQIPPSAQLPRGWDVAVVSENSLMGPLLLAIAAVAVLTGIAARVGADRRAAAVGWFLSAAASLFGLLRVVAEHSPPNLLEAAVYEKAARARLSDIEGAEALVGQGKFVWEGDLFVPFGAVAPEVAMLAVACLVGLFAGIFSLRKSWPGTAGDEPRRVAMGLYARDFSLRAIMLAWLSWLLVTLIHWTHFGAVGVGSVAEWHAVGVLAIATGVVLLGWSRRNSRVDRLVRELVPGIVFALFVIGLALSLVFNAPFGVSIAF